MDYFCWGRPQTYQPNDQAGGQLYLVTFIHNPDILGGSWLCMYATEMRAMNETTQRTRHRNATFWR